MGYNRVMLRSWSQMGDWGTYLDRNGGLTDRTSQEGFDFLEKRYYQKVNERIECCKKILRTCEDELVCYTLAELYDRCNEDKSPIYLFKKPVIFYALKALELNPNFIPAKELLRRTKKWVEFMEEG